MNEENTLSQLTPEEEELKLFLGVDADYFLKKWRSIDYGASSKIAMNFFAFFFTTIWLAFKKVYSVVFIVHGASFIYSILELIFINPYLTEESYRIYSYLLLFAIALLFGNLGNYWYLLHARKKIARIKNEITDIEKQRVAIKKSGGSSLLSMILPIILWVIHIYALDFIYFMIY